MTEANAIELARLLLTTVPALLPSIQTLLDRGVDPDTAVRLALRTAVDADSGPMLTHFERAYQEAIDGVDTKKLKISSIEDADKKAQK